MIEKKNSMIGLYICSPLWFGLVNVSKGKQTKCLGMKLYNIYIYIYIPGTHLSFVLGVGPAKTRSFTIKSVIWLPGMYCFYDDFTMIDIFDIQSM